MTTELAQKLDSLPEGFDYTDANAIAAAMGYSTDADEGEGGTSQGDTAAAAPAAAPAPAAPAVAAPAPAAAPAAADSSTAPAAAADTAAQVAGVLTKDGKHVIPHSVLTDARRTAVLERQRADQEAAAAAELRKEIEALRNGTSVPSEKLTTEALDELENNYPDLKPLLDSHRAMQAQLATRAPAPQSHAPDPLAVAEQEVALQNDVDVALAARPLLTRAREGGGVLWGRAVELDNALQKDQAFAAVPLAQRFAEVERRLSAELGLPVAAPAPAAAPAVTLAAAPASGVAAAIAAAPHAGPSTLSDITGTAPRVEVDAWEERSAVEGLAAAEKLSDEGLMRMAGLSY